MSSDTSGKPTITGLVLTYNGERLLGKCLESLAFCDAVIVVDSFSSDATESIAREHGATFVQHPWSGALPQFEYALGLVETDWVVSLDQDEICSEPLRDAILAALPGAPADLCGFTPARRSWYYDRFLNDFDGCKIGICYSACVKWELPHGFYDRPVDLLVTERYFRKIHKEKRLNEKS